MGPAPLGTAEPPAQGGSAPHARGILPRRPLPRADRAEPLPPPSEERRRRVRGHVPRRRRPAANPPTRRADRTRRSSRREACGSLAHRDDGERVVAAELTIDELAETGYFPMIAALAAAGRRSERGVDDARDRYRLHVKPAIGGMRLGDVEPSDV